MDAKVLHCPNCGANLSVEDTVCKYCNSPIYIRRFEETFSCSERIQEMISFYKGNCISDNNLAASELSLAICYLYIKQYDLALTNINEAISSDLSNPFTYYYKAICLFRGKRPFKVNRSVINEAETCLQTALSIHEYSEFYFLWAIIRYDYYYRKCFNISPEFQELLKKIDWEANYSEISFFFDYDFKKILLQQGGQ